MIQLKSTSLQLVEGILHNIQFRHMDVYAEALDMLQNMRHPILHHIHQTG